jgi:uncharacterized protein with ParB-like and HNH nuclease domain
MKAEEKMLLDFLEGKDKKFIMPVFQRNYDWKEVHCIQLFKDIETLAKNPNRKSHFLGTIVYIANSEVDMMNMREYVLIDGQQRITTIMLLLKAVYDYTNINNEKKELELKDRIQDYLINKYAEDKNRLRLKPTKNDNTIFKAIMNNDFSAIDKNMNIYKNYILFKELIKNSSLTPWNIFEGIRKIVIVYISLMRSEDDPQLIFESLNSTGLSLSQADLIRNFILMDKEPTEQEELFEKYWNKIETLLNNENISDFVRDYLTFKTRKIPNKNEVYFDFKKYVFSSENEFNQIEALLTDLLYYAEIYSCIINCTHEDKKINFYLKKFRKLKVSVCYPFLLELFSDYNKLENLDKIELLKILDLLISYIFRRMICEYPTNALNKIFMILGKEIKQIKNFDNNYFENITKILLLKKSSSAFPSELEFKNSFLNREMYKFKGVKFLLEELENFDNNEKVSIEELSIEHIMPQKLNTQWKVLLGDNFSAIHEKYLHNIGNLSLTGDNQNLSNKIFKEKKKIFEESRLKLNKIFEFKEIWNEKEIEQRALHLYNLASKIWKYPELKIKGIEKSIVEKEIYNFYDDIIVTNTKPISFNFLGEDYHVKTWKEFFKKISEILIDLDYQKFKSFTTDPDFQGRNYRVISTKNNVRKPIKVAEEIILESNMNANATLNYIKMMVEKFDLLDKDFTFRLK